MLGRFLYLDTTDNVREWLLQLIFTLYNTGKGDVVQRAFEEVRFRHAPPSLPSHVMGATSLSLSTLSRYLYNRLEHVSVCCYGAARRLIQYGATAVGRSTSESAG
eukprot:3086497-Rhodomonas_salina.1